MSQPSLILVRHAAPEQQPQVPPPQWRLSSAGRAAAARLADQLAGPAPAAICASCEPKAVETAEIIASRFGLVVESDAAFDEHHRPDWPFETDPAAFVTRVLRVLAEPETSVDGAETGETARRRFATGVASRSVRPLLVATHGAVLSLYLAQACGLDAQDLWRSLRMPEALLLDAEGRLLGRVG